MNLKISYKKLKNLLSIINRFKVSSMRGYEDYKQILIKFKQLLQEKFGDNLISLVLFG